MAQRLAGSTRSYYRVETRLAARLRRATLADVATLEQRLAGPDPDGDGQADLSAPAWARQLEFKIDRMIALLDPTLPRPLDPQALRRVVISGAGMRMECEDEDLAAGDDVLVELLLGQTAGPVTAIGELVARYPGGRDAAHDEVSVRFRLIDESDRDAIVRLVNRVDLAQRHRMRPEGAVR